MKTPSPANAPTSPNLHRSQKALKRLNTLGTLILMVVAAALSIALSSWKVFWAFVGIAFAIEILFSAAARLVDSADRPLTVGDLRGLDRIIGASAGIAMVLVLIGTTEQFVWSNTDKPLSIQIQSDHRSTSLTEDQYRLFAWECEANYGRGPVEVKRSGQDSYVRCGGMWPSRKTLAAKTEQFDKASKAYWSDPNAPVTIPLSK